MKGIIGYGFRRRLLPQNGGMRLVYAKTTWIQTGSVPPTLIDSRPTRKLRLGSRESRDNVRPEHDRAEPSLVDLAEPFSVQTRTMTCLGDISEAMMLLRYRGGN